MEDRGSLNDCLDGRVFHISSASSIVTMMSFLKDHRGCCCGAWGPIGLSIWGWGSLRWFYCWSSLSLLKSWQVFCLLCGSVHIKFVWRLHEILSAWLSRSVINHLNVYCWSLRWAYFGSSDCLGLLLGSSLGGWIIWVLDHWVFWFRNMGNCFLFLLLVLLYWFRSLVICFCFLFVLNFLKCCLKLI